MTDVVIVTVTQNDIIFDLIGALFYFAVILYSSHALWNIHVKRREHLQCDTIVSIIFVFFIAAGILYLHQAVAPLVASEMPSYIRIWDILNYIQAVATLMAVHFIRKSVGDEYGKWEKKFPI